MNIYFGENIKRLRKEKNLTQESFANMIGVSFQAVSKWERDECYPDITLLPLIASCFETTIDDLLGTDKAKSDKKISDYLSMYDEMRLKDRTLVFNKFQNAVKEFPNDFRILVRYMELLIEEKDEPFTPNPDYVKTDDPEAEKSNNPYKHGLMKNPCYEKVSRELLSIYDNIQNRCMDDSIRTWSKHLLIMHLMKKYHLSFDVKTEKWRCDDEALKKAEEILSSMPAMCDSREYLSLMLEDMESFYKIRENAIEELLYLLQNVIISYCYYEDKYSAQYKINVIHHMNELFKIVDSDEHYSKNRMHMIYNYGHLGHLYFEIGDNENAYKYLKIAAEYAKAFDSNPDAPEKIYRFYEKGERFNNMDMRHRMKSLMTEYYVLSDEFKSKNEFKEILSILD